MEASNNQTVKSVFSSILLGTLNIIDADHMDILVGQLRSTVPPMPNISPMNTVLCMDMDEGNTYLEDNFPNSTIKATLLCPPPAAMIKEVDGDSEGFIEAYNNYLDNEPSVQEFITSMLFYMHTGGNILLYTPSYLVDGALWMNTLIMFFFTRYGITIGTSLSNPYTYDNRYDGPIVDLLYKNNFIDIFDYVYSCPYAAPSMDVYSKSMYDLAMISGPDINPLDTFTQIKNSFLISNVPISKPAILFEV